MYDSYTSTVGQHRTYPLGFTHNRSCVEHMCEIVLSRAYTSTVGQYGTYPLGLTQHIIDRVWEPDV